jgi:hypothetical protein
MQRCHRRCPYRNSRQVVIRWSDARKVTDSSKIINEAVRQLFVSLHQRSRIRRAGSEIREHQPHPERWRRNHLNSCCPFTVPSATSGAASRRRCVVSGTLDGVHDRSELAWRIHDLGLRLRRAPGISRIAGSPRDRLRDLASVPHGPRNGLDRNRSYLFSLG